MGRQRNREGGGTYRREGDLPDERVRDVHERAHARDERRALDRPQGDNRVMTRRPAVWVVLDACKDDREQDGYEMSA